MTHTSPSRRGYGNTFGRRRRDAPPRQKGRHLHAIHCSPTKGKTGNQAKGQYYYCRAGCELPPSTHTPPHLDHDQMYSAPKPPLVAGGEPPSKATAVEAVGCNVNHPPLPALMSLPVSTLLSGPTAVFAAVALPPQVVTSLVSITLFARVSRKGSRGWMCYNPDHRGRQQLFLVSLPRVT